MNLRLLLMLPLALLQVLHFPGDHCPSNLILNRTVLRDLTLLVALCISTLLLWAASVVTAGNLRQNAMYLYDLGR